MEVVPLSQYFVCTKYRDQNEFNAIKWLSMVDDAIIERIIDSSETFFEMEESQDEEGSFDCMDYLTLCFIIGEVETEGDSDNFNEQIKHNCLVGLATFARCEKLRREGILSFVGTGKITEFHQNTTDIELTEVGKVVGSSMRTMMEISKAVEKDEKSA